MTRWLTHIDPIGLAFKRCRTATAIGLTALLAGPIFVLLLLMMVGVIDITVLMRIKGTAMAMTLAKSPVYGLVAGLPMAGICAALIGMLARRGWDAFGISLAVGTMASVLPAAGLIYFVLAQIGKRLAAEPELLWQLPLALTPFAVTGALMCALFWRIAIRHRRHARLTILQDQAAIRAME